MPPFSADVRVDSGRRSARVPPNATRQLQRFPLKTRRAVSALANRDPRLADLAVSFPALLFVIAVPRHRFAPAPLIERVVAGDNLKTLSRLAGLPFWSRRLMPECFDAPIGLLPDCDLVSRQIVNHLPRSPKHAGHWVHAVAETARWGTPEAAVWLARELTREKRPCAASRLPALSLYVWYSSQPHTLAGSLIVKQWDASMRLATAMDHVFDWLESINLYAQLGTTYVEDTWLNPAAFDGYDFKPLRTAADIRREALSMRNCLRSYGEGIVDNRCRLWRIERDGQQIGVMELRRRFDAPLFEIGEIKACNNDAVADAVWWTAYRWLCASNLNAQEPAAATWRIVPLDRSVWLALWRPYWLAKRARPAWLPLTPSSSALNDL